MELWLGALNLGLLYGFMAIGTLITFRILNFSDITVDGSFTTGAAVTAVMITSGVNPFLALLAGFLAGGAAGLCTGLIYTKMKINGLLAGILVMIGLYSINLRIMGKSNIPLLELPTFITWFNSFNPGMAKEIWISIFLLIVMTVFWLLMSIFFKTDLGITIRVTGDNPVMASANSVNTDLINILGLTLANGLVGISGGLVAQYQGFADIGMGIGTLMIGLASVIIGESLLKDSSIYITILSAVTGSVVYRFMIAFALYGGMNPVDLKLFTSLFVLITLYVTHVMPVHGKKIKWAETLKGYRRILIPAGIILVIGIFFISNKNFRSLLSGKSEKFYKIGVLQLNDNGLLNVTRDAFSEEMKKIGYIDGKNCTIELQNAQGDMPTVNTIIDKYIMNGYDVIVSISSGTTQAAINKTKTIPVVFATVANPFILGAGSSENDHLPNVTGVYGWIPMENTVAIVKTMFPGKIKIGTMWDPSQVNAVYNVGNLEKEVKKDSDITFEGVTINGSSEVYQAATSLTGKNIDMFVLPPDNIVFSAFDSIVKAGNEKRIPILINDIDRLKDGALFAYGYDYAVSGLQAAHLVDRILRGEKPQDIPFETYKKIEFGINMGTVKKLNINIPEKLFSQATIIIKEDGTVIKKEIPPQGEKEKKLALFRFNDNELLMETIRGVMDRLKESRILEKHNIKIYEKTAQNDFSTGQSIAQELVQEKYDYIITVSTPALQSMAQVNKVIPHVFGAVTDPYRMGVAKTSQEHQSNITGVATCQPVERSFELMREIFPEAEKVGIIWNPSEACSQVCTEKARMAAKKYNFQLLEVNVSGTSEIMDSLNSLLNKDIDIFITSGDNTVNLSMKTIAQILSEKKIPYFTNTFSDVEGGAFLSAGADYYEVGEETAKLAERIIKGENPKDIPVENYVPEKIYVNLKLAKQLGIEIPENILKKAAKVLK
ncbi:MAG: ABC transporter substrate binding protein [Candidatus Eremiobacterota bacterium]